MKTPSTDDLIALAETHHTHIAWHIGGPKGWYHHHTRTISLRSDLRAANLRCTLAHELGHALTGDVPTGIQHFDRRMERAADMTAANMLISHAEYAAAEALYGAHDGAIARELGVTTHLLAIWRNTYGRQKQ